MSNKVMIILVGFLFVLMLGLSAGLFMIWTKLSTADAAVKASETTGDQQPLTESLGSIFSLETFIVNLADEGGKRYLRVTMDLELSDGVSAEDVGNRLPQVRDGILMILPSKHFEDIRTVEGKTSLRNEIIDRLNSIFGRETVSNIFFTEFVVQ
jgi:flagellar FliL protein